MIVSGLLIDLEGELVQEWLQQRTPFDAVVDGANVAMNQHNFSFFQVRGLLSSLKKNLIIEVLIYSFWF